MTYLQAILMGLIQGITEFLPISSSAHIVLVSSLYKFFTHKEFVASESGEAFFDIMLHFGTLIAIFIYFRKELFDIIKSFFVALKTRDFSSPQSMLPAYIIAGTFATAIIVFPLKDITEKLISAPDIVGLLLVVTGFILYFSEIIFKKYSANTKKMNWKTAILTGVAQGLAIFPGISRSGLTISTAVSLGVNRVVAAKYSFLLSIPIILGASLLYPIHEFAGNTEVDIPSIGILFVGGTTAAISGFLCIKFFIKFLQKFSMKVFAYYCWIIGFLMFVGFKFLITLV